MRLSYFSLFKMKCQSDNATLTLMLQTVIFQNTSSEAKTGRLKTLERAGSACLPAVRLTKRDIAIVNACYEYRALTTPQIQQLIFGQQERSAQVKCQQRLKLLFHHGYLHRDEQPTKLTDGRRPLIYFLDKKGAQFLAGCLDTKVSELDWDAKDNTAGAGHLFIDHLLKTNDVRIAITLATLKQNAAIERWIDDKMLRRRHTKAYVTLKETKQEEQRVALVPDGYFHLRQQQHHSHYFLETDMCTVVGLSTKSGRRDWAKKIRSYLAYTDSGQFQERYHAQSFRVLTVTTGERRLANLKKITEEVGGKARFWFTTFEQLSSETALSQSIWQVAGREGLYSLILNE